MTSAKIQPKYCVETLSGFSSFPMKHLLKDWISDHGRWAALSLWNYDWVNLGCGSRKDAIAFAQAKKEFWSHGKKKSY